MKWCRGRQVRTIVELLWLGIAFLAGPAGAGNASRSWQLVKETPEGRLYHRAVADSAIPEALIATRLNAVPAAVYAVVNDYAHFSQFIPNVVESRVLRVAGSTQEVFQRLHFPGPFADRVYVMKSTGQRVGSDPNEYRVEWQLIPGLLPAGVKGVARTGSPGSGSCGRVRTARRRRRAMPCTATRAA